MSVSSSGAITTTGNVAGTASYASNAELLDGLDSTVFTLTSSFAAQTASFTAFTSSQNILNGKYATTGSNTFTGIQTVNSNLVVTGSITAQTLVVQTITSSVDFVTGSTRFGSLLANTHIFSGSVTMNPGGLFVSSSGNVGIGTSSPGTNTLQVSTTSTTNAAYIEQNSTGNGLQVTTSGTSGTSFIFKARSTGVDRFWIGDTGNVGIGTSSPVSQATGATLGILDVSAATGGNLVLHRNGSGDTALFSILKASNGTYIDSTGAATAANNAIYFRTNNNNADQTSLTTALTIASTGAATFASSVTAASFVGNASTSTQPKSIYYASANFTSGTTGGTETANVSGYYLPYMTPIAFKLNINWIGNGSIQNNYIGYAQAVYWNNGTATIIWTANGISGGAGYPSVSVSVEGSAYNTRYLRISLTAEASTRPNQWNWAIDYWYPTP